MFSACKDDPQAKHEKKQVLPQKPVRIMMIGDSGVGKTSLLTRLRDKTFHDESYITTIGVDYVRCNLRVENQDVPVQIWDTAGQERFHCILPAYFRGVDAIVLCFSLVDADSWEHVARWNEQISHYAKPEVVVVLVATKADMQPQCLVDKDILQTSAKTNFQVQMMFEHVVAKVLKERAKQPQNMTDTTPLRIVPFAPEDRIIANVAANGTKSCCQK